MSPWQSQPSRTLQTRLTSLVCSFSPSLSSPSPIPRYPCCKLPALLREQAETVAHEPVNLPTLWAPQGGITRPRARCASSLPGQNQTEDSGKNRDEQSGRDVCIVCVYLSHLISLIFELWITFTPYPGRHNVT